MTCHLCDAHAHIGKEGELKERIREKLPSLVCASSPAEAILLAKITRGGASPFIIPTYGLHPWHAAQYSVADMEPFFADCDVIGEIGMDSIWCDVPLHLQRAVFQKQLAIASELKKPVILHTKGQEKEIAGLIKCYPNTYMVHWYSSPDLPDSFMESDCYFSIGPDIWWNKAVRQVAALVPANRLLLETDGMGAVQWAWEEAPKEAETYFSPSPPATIKEALATTLKLTAEIRGIPEEILGQQIEENFCRFIKSRS